METDRVVRKYIDAEAYTVWSSAFSVFSLGKFLT